MAVYMATLPVSTPLIKEEEVCFVCGGGGVTYRARRGLGPCGRCGGRGRDTWTALNWKFLRVVDDQK